MLPMSQQPVSPVPKNSDSTTFSVLSIPSVDRSGFLPRVGNNLSWIIHEAWADHDPDVRNKALGFASLIRRDIFSACYIYNRNNVDDFNVLLVQKIVFHVIFVTGPNRNCLNDDFHFLFYANRVKESHIYVSVQQVLSCSAVFCLIRFSVCVHLRDLFIYRLQGWLIEGYR